MNEIVYALSAFTIKEDHGKFFIAKTVLWGGSHHTNAIARHLEREWSEREPRQVRFANRFKR